MAGAAHDLRNENGGYRLHPTALPYREGPMLKLFGHALLDPDGVHAHSRDDCPRVRRLHPGELRAGFTAGRTDCPSCLELRAPKQRRAARV
jgi:hypothetical protein